jgi:hypothetical protein
MHVLLARRAVCVSRAKIDSHLQMEMRHKYSQMQYIARHARCRPAAFGALIPKFAG